MVGGERRECLGREWECGGRLMLLFEQREREEGRAGAIRRVRTCRALPAQTGHTYSTDAAPLPVHGQQRLRQG